MIVTLTEMKAYLGIASSTYDNFLTRELGIIDNAVQNYCGRIFDSASYTQTIYADQFENLKDTWDIYLYHYPVTAITSINVITKDSEGNDTSVAETNYRLQGSSGHIIRTYASGSRRYWFSSVNDAARIEVTYTAGYSTMPSSLQAPVYSLVNERYNKHINGVDLEFGSNVQRVSIPGVISLDFDYTLQANERKSAFGMILGNYLNVFDFWRSERALVGEIRLNYVV